MRRFIGFIFVAATLAGCNQQQKLTCDNSEVLTVLSELSLKNVKENLFYAAFMDTDSAKAKFDAFRTRKTVGNMSYCIARVKYDISAKSFSSKEDQQYAAVFTASVDSLSGTEVLYRIELMDSGQEFSVEILN